MVLSDEQDATCRSPKTSWSVAASCWAGSFALPPALGQHASGRPLPQSSRPGRFGGQPRSKSSPPVGVPAGGPLLAGRSDARPDRRARPVHRLVRQFRRFSLGLPPNHQSALGVQDDRKGWGPSHRYLRFSGRSDSGPLSLPGPFRFQAHEAHQVEGVGKERQRNRR
jgi:hypothetical protein